MAATSTLPLRYLVPTILSRPQFCMKVYARFTSAKGTEGILLGTRLLLRAVCALQLITMMYIKCITYVVVMCIDNYICHAPLYTSPAVHPISLPPPAFILIFQISEKLQTAGTFYLFFFLPLFLFPLKLVKYIFLSLPITGDFFRTKLILAK